MSLPIISYSVPTFAYICLLFPNKCRFHCGINRMRSSGNAYLHNLILLFKNDGLMQIRISRNAGSFLFIERWCCNVAESNIEKYNKSLTQAERKENASKAGIASGKARAETKSMKDTLQELLAMPIKDGKSIEIDEIKSIAGAKGKNVTMQEAIMLAMLDKASKGDVKAAEYIRDTVGQKPSDKMKLEAEVSMNDKLREVESYVKGKWSDG